MKSMTKSVSVRLPEATVEELERACRETGSTASSVVRSALEQYLTPTPAPARRRLLGGRRGR